jgi:hypothetical protein
MIYNQRVTAEQLVAIRTILDDFDLIMLISEIHDHGWPRAAKLLPEMIEAQRLHGPKDLKGNLLPKSRAH